MTRALLLLTSLTSLSLIACDTSPGDATMNSPDDFNNTSNNTSSSTVDMGQSGFDDMSAAMEMGTASDQGTSPEDMPDQMLVEGVGEPCDVDGEEGFCLETQDCAPPGVATPGHCPGPSQVQCCTMSEEMMPDMGMEMDMLPVSQKSGCGEDPGSNDRTWTLQHDGREREFEVHIPRGYDRDMPTAVVINFHGRNSNITQQKLLSGMVSVSDEKNFIVVHPEGIGNTWNAGLCCGTASSQNIDDVGFVDAMLDALERDLCVDDRRIYATGLSNGGFISNRVGCELSDRFAAIAPVAGGIMSSCNPEHEVSVMHFHGTSDSIVPYDGFAGFNSIPDSIAEWRTHNGCTRQSTIVFQSGDVTCESWSCAAMAEVQLCTVDGGGHQWPGGTSIPGLGYNTDDIDASRAMWDFFIAHPKQ